MDKFDPTIHDDNLPLDAAFLAGMKMSRRGRPKLDTPKVEVKIRLDARIVEHLRGSGRADIARSLQLSNTARVALAQMAGVSVLTSPGGDPTKLVIDVSGLGHSGFSAAQWLRDHERVHVELADFRRIVCSLTVGDTAETCAILVEAFVNLAAAKRPADGTNNPVSIALPPIPPRPLTPRAALNSRAEPVDLDRASGRTCAEYVIPYPPGIPLVVPGETLTGEVLAALQGFRGAGSRIVGPDDPTGQTLLVTPA